MRTKVGIACAVVLVAVAAGCDARKTAPPPDAKPPRSVAGQTPKSTAEPIAEPTGGPTAEQTAARDALRRFASFAKAEHLYVARDPLLEDSLPAMQGCKLEFVTRDELIARHRGERRAPMILAVTVQPHDPSIGATITVLVALEMAAIEGFEEVPDGLGREYVYRSTATGADFVKEQSWVE